MRASDDLPPRQRPARVGGRGRIIAIVAVVSVIFLLLSLRGIAGFYTDFLWFDSLDRTDVWRNVLGAKFALTLIFGGLFFVLLWVNLMIADRIAPPFRAAGPEEELLARYHDAVAGRTVLLRTGVSLLFAVIAGAGVSGQWEDWLLFVNRQDFGIDDPQFGRDIGFYVFELPFLSYVVSWAFNALVVILILTTIAHYLNGGIRVQSLMGERVTANVKVHLSAILAVLALVKAADYWLERFSLTVSSRGVVDGALYTDVNAQLPAINLLMLISLFAVVLLVVNLRRRGWVLPVLAVGLWAFVAIVVGSIYPAFVQRFQVEPNETTKEADFTERNIEATRAAYGLTLDEDMELVEFDYTEELSVDDLRADADTVRNARLLDPVEAYDSFERFQSEREIYRLPGPLDTDRYMVDGELTQVMLSSRELNLDELSSWERQHVALTHGYGVAVARANVTTNQGRPDFLTRGLPIQVDERFEDEFGEFQPGLYHGEDLGGYALVGATRDEVDYIDSSTGNEVPTRYDGDSGVAMNSFFRQAAFALRFGEIDPLISNFVDNDTSVIYVRDVRERVEKVAPFLDLDADAYPVVVNGRVKYVIDAYTTTSRYPYSQTAENGRLDQGSGLAGSGFNYVRNSVKAVVDAYDGDVALYVMPVDDPIIEAWRGAFPDLFSDFDDMPQELRDHLRYPEDIFRVQTNMWANYQVGNARNLIDGVEAWAIAQDPGHLPSGLTFENEVDAETGLATQVTGNIAPYYALMELPGEDELSYVNIRSFVPASPDGERQELEAFVAGEVGSDGSTRLVTYEVSGSEAPGPSLVSAGMDQNDEIARTVTLLNPEGSGSRVRFGDLLLLPVQDSILWVRPLYVAAESTAVPALRFVIAAIGDGEQIALGNDLQDALEQLFPGEDLSGLLERTVNEEGEELTEDDVEPDPDLPDPDPETEPDDGQPLDPEIDPDPLDPGTPTDVLELLADIEEARSDAGQAYADGEWQEFADLQERIDELTREIEIILRGTGGTPVTPNPSDDPPTETTAPDAEIEA